MSTAGFSSHDAGHGCLAGPRIECITIALMVPGGAYLAMLAVTTLVSISVPGWNEVHSHPFTALRSAPCHAVSAQTSTGFWRS